MNPREFEALVAAYLEGAATAEQILTLRNTLTSSVDMRARFHSLVLLHRAQIAALSRRESLSFESVVMSLQAYAQRAGRILAHLCILGLIFVQLQVTLPVRYAGLLWYVESESSDTTVTGTFEMPSISDENSLAKDGIDQPESTSHAEISQMPMPVLVMPDPSMPSDEAEQLEV